MTTPQVSCRVYGFCLAGSFLFLFPLQDKFRTGVRYALIVHDLFTAAVLTRRCVYGSDEHSIWSKLQDQTPRNYPQIHTHAVNSESRKNWC